MRRSSCWPASVPSTGRRSSSSRSRGRCLVLSVGAISLLYWLLRHGGAADVARLFYLVPAVTSAMAFVLFGERLDALALAGMALIAVGVAMARPRGGLGVRRGASHRPRNAAVHRSDAGVEPDRVREIGRPRDVPQREVGAPCRRSRLPTSSAMPSARAALRVTPRERLQRRQAEQRARHVHRGEQRRERRGPGIAVGRHRDRHAASRSASTGGSRVSRRK